MFILSLFKSVSPLQRLAFDITYRGSCPTGAVPIINKSYGGDCRVDFPELRKISFSINLSAMFNTVPVLSEVAFTISPQVAFGETYFSQFLHLACRQAGKSPRHPLVTILRIIKSSEARLGGPRPCIEPGLLQNPNVTPRVTPELSRDVEEKVFSNTTPGRSEKQTVTSISTPENIETRLWFMEKTFSETREEVQAAGPAGWESGEINDVAKMNLLLSRHHP